MIPEHCREVGVKKVDFQLTKDEIFRNLSDKKMYTATNYIVLHNDDEWAVCKIEKEEGFELFRKVTGVEIVSLPDDTLFVEAPDVDVLNKSSLVGRAEEAAFGRSERTVVVKGEFDHISFSSDEHLLPLIIYEVVPPEPPKLIKLTERVIKQGRISRPVKIVPKTIRIDEMAEATNAGTVMFPCRTSKLDAIGKKTVYLDELPPLESLGDNVALLGCSLSDRIFKSHYHRKPEHINFCPADLVKGADLANDGVPVLLKCCKYKNEYEIEGNIIKVPWGVTIKIIEDALNDYFMTKNHEKGVI